MPGYPVFSWIPGWTLWHNLFDDFPGGYMAANIVRGLPFFVLIPAFVLRRLGVKRRGFGFSGGDLKPAIPFLLIYTAAFLVSGLTVERWVFLLYAVLYSGFQEEFFFRVMQPLFSCHQETVWGMGLSVALFALLHIPTSFSGIPHVPLALSSVASTALFGG